LKTTTIKSMSPGLAYITAARDAMPNTIGDRVRISGMSSAMAIAVRCRFRFDTADAEKLSGYGYGIETSVGVFRPLDKMYYSQACVSGGTYARMWESHTGIKPWIAARAFGRDPDRLSLVDDLVDNRVGEGMGVLIESAPEADMDGLAGMARTRDSQVWWCTSMDATEVILCRYRYQGDRRYPFEREGAPARKMKLTRKEWAGLVGPKPVSTPVVTSAAVQTEAA